MSDLLKAKGTIIALVVILSMLLSNVSIAQAEPPPLPSGFYGTVKVNGENVPLTTVVSAWINGVKYAYKIVEEYQGDTVYYFDVPGDQASTTGVIEGGVQGNTIVFKIGDLEAVETATWQSGTSVAHNISATTPVTCYSLTLSHSGTGTNLTASPTNSTGCETGKYVSGELISLSGAVPGAGWHISGWTGTENNNSTASTNTLSMPASNASASVIYAVNPPVAPQLVSPKKGSTTNKSIFSWKPVLNAVRYQIQVSRFSNFTPLLFSASSTIPSYTRTGMKDGQYYWRVKAINSSGGTFSVAWFFKLDKTPPAVPILTKPANNTKATGIPTYSWMTAAGAKYYIFECSRNSTFTTIAYKSGKLITTSYKPLIQPAGIYYWRVRALDVAGNESKSVIWKITVK